MKTKLAQLSFAAALALSPLGVTAADQAPAPSAPPSPTSPSNPANPAGVSSGAAAEKPAATEASRYQGKITAVDKEAKTVTVEEKTGGTRKLHIADSTKLEKEGSATANWTDLKVGAQIEGTGSKHGEMLHAETVKVSTSTDADK